jgi:glycosyltransferase involved in cell wall biosynthesis
MKALLLNTSELGGGAAKATHRLHRGLRAIGVDSHLLVQTKQSTDSTVIGPSTKLDKLSALVRQRLDGQTLWSSRKTRTSLFSYANVPDGLAKKIETNNPDIVHLFWVNGGFLRVDTIRKIKRPIVWTLHDMWPFTGGCHYDDECYGFKNSCGNCPVLRSNDARDLSHQVWSRKQKSWQELPIVVVATSYWLADMARASSLFRNKRIEVLPNGLDTDKYKPADKAAARAIYNLPLNKQLILFSAFGAISDKRKGYQFLLPALKLLSECGRLKNIELVIVGSEEPQHPLDFGVKAHYMGHLHDDVSQVLLYSAADVLVSPSVQENLSNAVMESLACGTPVVAFNIGGMPDMIEHKGNGYLAKPFDHISFAEGISWVLSDASLHEGLSSRARSLVVARFGLDIVARRYQTLYRDVLSTFSVTK